MMFNEKLDFFFLDFYTIMLIEPITIGLIGAGLFCLIGACFISPDSDPKKPDDSKKKVKKVARWVLIIAGITLLGTGCYLHFKPVAPQTGFDHNLLYAEFIKQAPLKALHGGPADFLTYYTSFNPEGLTLDEGRTYRKLFRPMMMAFDNLPNQKEWVNSNGQGLRLLTLIDFHTRDPNVDSEEAQRFMMRVLLRLSSR